MGNYPHSPICVFSIWISKSSWFLECPQWQSSQLGQYVNTELSSSIMEEDDFLSLDCWNRASNSLVKPPSKLLRSYKLTPNRLYMLMAKIFVMVLFHFSTTPRLAKMFTYVVLIVYWCFPGLNSESDLFFIYNEFNHGYHQVFHDI